MTTSTERLRALLDERGVLWTQGVAWNVTVINGDWLVVEDVDFGTLSVSTTAYQLTPEQAIAATLGSEQPPVDKLIRCLENDYGITASWDGLRKVWLIERATLGSDDRYDAGFASGVQAVFQQLEGIEDYEGLQDLIAEYWGEGEGNDEP